MTSPHNHGHSARGFSLIELIVVIAIIGIIAVFAVPAASTIIRGSQLSQASQMLSDQINLARQYALTKNRQVEVRFIMFADKESPGEEADQPETGRYRGIQLFEVLPGGDAVPIGKLNRLPVTTMINAEELSTLVAKQETKGRKLQEATELDPELDKYVGRKYKYMTFRFLPDGSTDLVPTERWYATVHSITDVVEGNKPPPNFFTLQVDPVSGTTKSYRPTAG